MLTRGKLPGVDDANHAAMVRGLLVVFIPGFTIVFGLLWLVIPSRQPITTLYGCYQTKPLPLIRVNPSAISVDSDNVRSTRLTIEKGKEGYEIQATPGLSFKTDQTGEAHAFTDYPLGELITVFLSQTRPPALGLLLDGEQVEVPKVSCPASNRPKLQPHADPPRQRVIQPSASSALHPLS